MILVLIFEVSVAIVPPERFWGPPYEQTALQLKAAEADRGGDYDLLIAGDCTGWAGIRPTLLDRGLGSRSYNFSVNVAQTYQIEDLLVARYLDRSPTPPRAVVVQLSALSLLSDVDLTFPILRDHVLPYFPVREDLREGLPSGLNAQLSKYAFWTLLPSIRKQYIFHKSGWWALAFSPTGGYDDFRTFYEAERGFFSEDRKYASLGGRRPFAIDSIPASFYEFRFSDHNVRHIRRLIARLHDRAIPVFFCLTPVREEELRIWNTVGLHERLRDWVRREFAGGAEICDLVAEIPDPARYVDTAHLDERGAEQCTRALATWLKPRWKAP